MGTLLDWVYLVLILLIEDQPKPTGRRLRKKVKEEQTAAGTRVYNNWKCTICGVVLMSTDVATDLRAKHC